MKAPCEACGCHFPQDFDETLNPPCNFWGDWGMSTLPIEYKQKIWEWFFSIPVDEIAIKFNLGIGITLSAHAIQPEVLFENVIPGYTELDEDGKQRVQKEYFKTHGKIRVPTTEVKKANG